MSIKPLKKLLAENDQLIHSKMKKVESHVQRKVGDWFHNTVLIEESDVPLNINAKRNINHLKVPE